MYRNKPLDSYIPGYNNKSWDIQSPSIFHKFLLPCNNDDDRSIIGNMHDHHTRKLKIVSKNIKHVSTVRLINIFMLAVEQVMN